MQAIAFHLIWLLHAKQTTKAIVDQSTFQQSTLSRSNRHKDDGQNTKHLRSLSAETTHPKQWGRKDTLPEYWNSDWTIHKLELKLKDLHIFTLLSSAVKIPLSAKSLASPAKCHDQIPATYGGTSPTFAQ